MGFPYPRFIANYQRQNFWHKTTPGPNGCLEWTGSITAVGYPTMSIHGRQVGAHRVGWVIGTGKEIPDGWEIDHLCRNIKCVNPEHLEAVTRRENLRRSRVARGLSNQPPYDEPAITDRVCQLCGRVGQRNFTINEGWICKNTEACRRRRLRQQPDQVAGWQILKPREQTQVGGWSILNG
jgi:hypothetical protein